MWLGALSAPNSIFVHASRPLISENGTSTIVHEIVHVLLMDLKTPRDQDWIDEGLAEFLSLRALKDSGTISRRVMYKPSPACRIGEARYAACAQPPPPARSAHVP